jgi:voltage-gated potassium channel
MKKALTYVANRIRLILAIYIASLLTAGATFALLEDKSFGDGLWWATVTALTIGYGDLAPTTAAGRIAGIFFGHFWIFVIIPMIIANIILNVVEDKHLFTDEEQRELMQRLRNVEGLLRHNHAIATHDRNQAAGGRAQTSS